MYSYIKGELVNSTDDTVVIENNGIGYEIICPFSLSSKLGHIGENTQVWLYQSVREDDISLYGFPSPQLKDMFLLLITVSGIGPKVAHSICSQIEPDKLALAVMGKDVKALTGIKGLGKKGAERIILELSDKFGKLKTSSTSAAVSVTAAASSSDQVTGSIINDAVEALLVLGYKQADAASAVSSAYEDGIDLSELIRRSLKSLAR
ncbi:MAG: Holliday junction branch migration protein RuvA [Clostridiales bacterium]|nr:Holliday junction branch migration protein RuvA [Clostridiales bacterium]